MLKLNIGCGSDYRSGFVNIDVRGDVGADRVMDIVSEWSYQAKSVELIVAQDIFEHLTLNQQEVVLSEISRVLAVGGRLIMRIPNIDDIFDRFENDHEVRNIFLYGETVDSGVWGAHKSGLTKLSLVTMCLRHNLRLRRVEAKDTNFEFEFEKSNTDLVNLKKITFINQSLGFGGAEIFNAGLISWLNNNGINVSSFAIEKRFTDVIGARKIPLVIDVIGDWKGLVKGLILMPLGIVYYAWLVWKNRQTDAILMTGFIEKILVTPWARALKIPVVWVEFAPLNAVFSKFLGLPKLIYRLVKDLPQKVIVPSQNTHLALIPQTRISQAKLVKIPCAVAIDVSHYSKLKTQNFLAVCISRLEEGKGQDMLIEAWREVIKSIPTAKLKIIGEGREFQSLKTQIANLKLDENIKLTGWVEDAVSELARAQVSVFPSLWPLEGFGLVAVESIALGIPVVGFDYGPLPEVVDKSCAILVQAGDIHALAQAIIKLFHNPKTAQAMGSRGHKRYVSDFTFAKVGPRYVSAITDAIANVRAHELLVSAVPAF